LVISSFDKTMTRAVTSGIQPFSDLNPALPPVWKNTRRPDTVPAHQAYP
jgi:hypothetical protein